MTSKRSSPDVLGSQEPTVRIAADYNLTDGTDAVKILQVGGFNPDPWQCGCLDDWMAITPGRRWIHRACGLSVARQNGKSGLAEGRIESGMVLYGERIIYTSHLQKTSTETFEEMAAFFDCAKFRKHIKDIKTALGREKILLTNGAKCSFLARTRNGGRGQHGDLLIFDEAQELDTDQQASFLPAISASSNPQTIYMGTPPLPEGQATVFRDIRKKAITGKTTGTSWWEFSVDEIGDVLDRERWALTNPALGRRILSETIATEVEQMSADTFARERLGWWTPIRKKAETALDADAWDACGSDEKKPNGKTAYGVKFSADDAEVCLCGAVIPADGPARISLIDRRTTAMGIQWLADWLDARYKVASCVVIDGRNGVDVLVEKISGTWRVKGSVVRPKANDVIAAVSTLTDAIGERSVTWYKKQTALRDSAVTSTKRKVGSGWAFGGENATPIEAAALALWGARNSKRDPSKQMRIG